MNRDLDFLANGKSFFVPFPTPPAHSIPARVPSPHEIDFGALPRLVTRPAADGHCADSLLLVDCLERLDVDRMDADARSFIPKYTIPPSHVAFQEGSALHRSVRHSLPVYCPSFLPSAPRSFGYILMPRVYNSPSRFPICSNGHAGVAGVACQPTDATGRTGAMRSHVVPDRMAKLLPTRCRAVVCSPVSVYEIGP